MRSTAWLIFATFIGVVISIALVGYLTGGWSVGPETYGLAAVDEGITLTEYDEHLLVLDREAADNAYREHIEHLFASWMRDATGQPARAVVGARQARTAYISVMKALEKREQEIETLKRLKNPL